MNGDVSVERDADGFYAVKIASGAIELNVRIAPDEAPLLAGVPTTVWQDGTVRVGESAGAPVHWSRSEAGGVAIMIGHDDQTWDIAVTISMTIFDALRQELSRS